MQRQEAGVVCATGSEPSTSGSAGDPQPTIDPVKGEGPPASANDLPSGEQVERLLAVPFSRDVTYGTALQRGGRRQPALPCARVLVAGHCMKRASHGYPVGCPLIPAKGNVMASAMLIRVRRTWRRSLRNASCAGALQIPNLPRRRVQPLRVLGRGTMYGAGPFRNEMDVTFSQSDAANIPALRRSHARLPTGTARL